MILPVITEPNPILHTPAEQVGEITPEIRQLVADMRETMLNAQGVGLAAPQVGSSLAICIAEYPSTDPHDPAIPFIALINPRVTWKSIKKDVLEEGCLSIPGVEAKITRPESVRIKAKDLDGNPIEFRTDGFLARILQHEIDHLNGILFTSYVTKKQLKTRPLVDYPRI